MLVMEQRKLRESRALRAILAGIAVAALAIGASDARAQTQSFDASICPKQDTDKFAVRLISGLGFLVEPSGFLARQPHGLPEADPTLPPDGCVGNPAFLRSISFPYDYEAALHREARPSMAAMRPSMLTIFGHSGPVSSQNGALELFEFVNKLYGNCLTTAEGLEICLACSKNEAPWCSAPINGGEIIHPEILGWVGRALPNTHDEYDGLPFAISCQNMFSQSVWCKVSYQMESGLWIAYQIKDTSIAVNDLFTFDAEIRRQIMALRAPELDGQPFQSGD